MKFFLTTILGLSLLFPLSADPQKKCGCKDCKCTKDSHCGCMAHDEKKSQPEMKCDESGKCTPVSTDKHKHQ